MILDSTTKYGAWTGAEIEAFLSATRIPLRVALTSQKGLLIVPVWFAYDAGRLWACSAEDSLLVRSLRAAPAIGFDVSTNDLPYQGVRGRGVARCSPTGSDELASLLEKYLAGTENELAQWLLTRPDTEALIDIEIAWLTSWDFSSRMDGLEKNAKRHPDLPL